MATNPFVNWKGDVAEQSLVKSLTTETIQCFGMPVTYLPRSLRREDVMYKEDILSNFTQVFEIEAYFENVMGWLGQGNILSKFGVQTQDGATLLISRDRFAEVFAGSGIVRPNEGDLVYMGAPVNALFEITYVEHEKHSGQFYPLGALNFFEVRLVLHTYNQEQFATGNTSIDVFQTTQEFPTAAGTESPNDPTDDNKYLADESLSIIDTSESS